MKSKRVRIALKYAVSMLVVAALLPAGLHGDCRADSGDQPPKPPAAFEARWGKTPTSYDYNPRKGTLDDQSRAAQDGEARDAVIASHGRSSNAGIYAIAALFFAIAGLIVWRRTRTNA